MGPPARLAALLASLLLAPAGLAQGLNESPPVEVEQVVLEETVVPLGDEVETAVEVRVGCDGQEAPGTRTLATFETSHPSWSNVILSPNTASWANDGSACTEELPYNATLQLLVSVTNEAPAFEQTRFPIETTVTKEPAAGDDRTYGPYLSNVTFTPGYHHLHDLRVDPKSQEAAPTQRSATRARSTTAPTVRPCTASPSRRPSLPPRFASTRPPSRSRPTSPGASPSTSRSPTPRTRGWWR